MDVSYSHLPRWRGFNLSEKLFINCDVPYAEDDFKWIADWGFNFVRLAIDYRCFTEPDDWTKFREDMLKQIDEAVDFGRRYGVHVNLNIGHHAPGYCRERFPETHPLNLWEDDEPLEYGVRIFLVIPGVDGVRGFRLVIRLMEETE